MNYNGVYKMNCFSSAFLLVAVGIFMLPEMSYCAGRKDMEREKNLTVPAENDTPALCSLFDFPVGAAVNSWNLPEGGSHHELLRHFNAFVYENEMKQDATEPSRGRFNLDAEKKLIAYRKKTGAKLRGHTLVWHNQVPDWMFTGSGENGKAEKDELFINIKEHIDGVVGAGKGSFYCWDVVNECIDDSSGLIRHDQYYDICGSDEYIAKAFHYAREADPDALLFLNDYNIEMPGVKQTGFYNEVKKLLAEGVPVDGVGMQCHISLYYPQVSDIQDAIEKFAALGLKVQVTELDMSLYREWNAPELTISNALLMEQAEKYRDLFTMFQYEHTAGNLDLVMFWGLSDDCTWLNDFPQKGRANWPLMFGKDKMPKPCYWILADPSRLEK
jgi:endo-1,4-beta-xylanase